MSSKFACPVTFIAPVTVNEPVLNVPEVDNDILNYLEDDGNPFAAITADQEGRTGIDWGVAGLPETFLLNGEGEILFRFAGPLIEGNYENIFLPELEKALAAE